MPAKASGSSASSSPSTTTTAKGGGAGIFRVKVANSIAATNGNGAPIHTATP